MSLKIIIEHRDATSEAREYVNYRTSQRKRNGYDLEGLPAVPSRGLEHGQCDNCADPLWRVVGDDWGYCVECKPRKQRKNQMRGFSDV